MRHEKLNYDVHDMVEYFTNDMWVIGNVRHTYISVKPRHSKHYPGGGIIMWGGIILGYFLYLLPLVISVPVATVITILYHYFSFYSRTRHGCILFYFKNKKLFADGAIGYDKTRIKRIANKMKVDVVLRNLTDITTPIYHHHKLRRY